MDAVLVILTAMSLAAAVAFGALAWRVGRTDRERQRARIAALATAMSPAAGGRGFGEANASVAFDEPVQTRLAVGSVFDRATDGLRGRPGIKLAIGGAMALLLIVAAFAGARDAAESTPTKAPAPLELMSMRHQREGTTLTVSGLVRNPAGGAAVDAVTAVVFAFDRAGTFVASGRAPLDFSTLAPGDESPFVVNVPNVSAVARYRVTFRSGNGVVRHIDRRLNQVQLAQVQR
jgi:hypothetical protein